MKFNYFEIKESTLEIVEDLLRRSMDIINNMSPSQKRNGVFGTFALILTKAGKLAELKKILSQVNNRAMCMEVLKAVGIELASEGYYDLALKMIEDLSVDILGMDIINSTGEDSILRYHPPALTAVGSDLIARDELLKVIAVHAVRNKDIKFAEKMISGIISPYIKIEALGELALAYCKARIMLEGIRRFIESLDILDELDRIATGEGRIYDLNIFSKSINLRGNLAYKIQIAGFKRLSRELINQVIGSLSNIYDDKYRLTTPVSYTHLTLPTTERV